jgi:hypothetical protein
VTSAGEYTLHVDFVAVSESPKGARDEILEAAATLKEMPYVLEVGAIEADARSDFDLAIYFLLRSFTDLEPFGTDGRYVRFLQGTVAPNLKAFSGASVKLPRRLPETGTYAACIALEAPEETYDWEVGERLDNWSQGRTAASVHGLAAGERQRYRGLAIAFGDEPFGEARPLVPGFDVTIVAGRHRRLV